MGIGVWQVVLILLIVLILFGAGKLPTVMGDLGKGIRNFTSGLKADGKPAAPPETGAPAPGAPAAGPARSDAVLPEPPQDEARTR